MRRTLPVLLLTFLAGCAQREVAYAAVHQIMPDPLILHLADGYYLAKDREGHLFLVEADDYGEAAIVRRIF